MKLEGIKTKVFSVVLILILMSPMLVSAYVAQSSQSYSFNMEYRLVNGKDNNEFYSFDNGKVTIRGHAIVYESAPGASPTPADIKYTLYKDSFGFDPSYGTVNGGIDKNFVGEFNVTGGSSDKYYLIIHKADIDDHKVRGNGTLTQ